MRKDHDYGLGISHLQLLMMSMANCGHILFSPGEATVLQGPVFDR